MKKLLVLTAAAALAFAACTQEQLSSPRIDALEKDVVLPAALWGS